MKLTPTSLPETLQQFAQHYTELYRQQHGHLPVVEADEQWQSPCEAGAKSEHEHYWQPIAISDALSFDNLEQALDITLHPDIKCYFTTLYSENLSASCDEGNLALLLPWNSDDFQRLQENIIGHVLMKQRLKQAVTIFFAVTDHDDVILSVNNDDGTVAVERVGCEPHKIIATSLAEFIATLTPEPSI